MFLNISNKKMTIKILITGGTIDDLEYDSPDKAPTSHKSLIPNLLKKTRITTDYDIEELMSKDSKFITEEDRKIILKKCKECKEDKIIITHGTITMATSAKFIGKEDIKKTIVLTGSAIPANKKDSDALSNLNAALTAVQTLPKGVYIAMNDKIFPWNNVKKNLETGYFEKEK